MLNPGERVKLNPTYLATCTSPERQSAYRGVVLEPTKHVIALGDAFRYVLWDGAIEPYPVLTKNLTRDGVE